MSHKGRQGISDRMFTVVHCCVRLVLGLDTLQPDQLGISRLCREANRKLGGGTCRLVVVYTILVNVLGRFVGFEEGDEFVAEKSMEWKLFYLAFD